MTRTLFGVLSLGFAIVACGGFSADETKNPPVIAADDGGSSSGGVHDAATDEDSGALDVDASALCIDALYCDPFEGTTLGEAWLAQDVTTPLVVRPFAGRAGAFVSEVQGDGTDGGAQIFRASRIQYVATDAEPKTFELDLYVEQPTNLDLSGRNFGALAVSAGTLFVGFFVYPNGQFELNRRVGNTSPVKVVGDRVKLNDWTRFSLTLKTGANGFVELKRRGQLLGRADLDVPAQKAVVSLGAVRNNEIYDLRTAYDNFVVRAVP